MVRLHGVKRRGKGIDCSTWNYCLGNHIALDLSRIHFLPYKKTPYSTFGHLCPGLLRALLLHLACTVHVLYLHPRLLRALSRTCPRLALLTSPTLFSEMILLMRKETRQDISRALQERQGTPGDARQRQAGNARQATPGRQRQGMPGNARECQGMPGVD